MCRNVNGGLSEGCSNTRTTPHVVVSTSANSSMYTARSANAEPKCSVCRAVLKRKDVNFVVLRKDQVTSESRQEDGVYRDKYGSKLNAVARYLHNLFGQEQTASAKVILFIQFRRLMTMVSKALTEMNVQHVHCIGNVHQRTKAIEAFKQSADVRLILLSSEDSVSGLHLPEATHVLIFHPFLIGGNPDQKKRGRGRGVGDGPSQKVDVHSPEMTRLAVDYEHQGVARAWRGGQTHPVQVVRFLTRRSIEEEMLELLNYKEGVITSLE
jgi:SNF2 family DNA or RNA helicase